MRGADSECNIVADSRLVSHGGDGGGGGMKRRGMFVSQGGYAVKLCVWEGNSCHWFLSTRCHHHFLLHMKYISAYIPRWLCEKACPRTTLSKELDLDLLHL